MQLILTIPDTGRVRAVLLDVAARDGFPVVPGGRTPAEALQTWLRAHVRGLYRQQALAAARQTAITQAEEAIEADVQSIA